MSLNPSVYVYPSGKRVIQQDERIVLYVEDEQAAVFLLELALRKARVPVRLHRVADGEQALEYLRRGSKADVVLMDLYLPRKSGHEVLAEVRQNPAFNDLPVVIFTSSPAVPDKQKSFALGAQMHIVKPAVLEDFINAVRDACSYPDRVCPLVHAAHAGAA